MALTKVVILNWNGRKHLERFLPSVVGTVPNGVDVVVADNGSDDDSTAFLRQHFPLVEIVQLDRNYGFAEGYNRALERLEADYFILLNSDVECAAGWVEPLEAALEGDDGLFAVAPKIRACTDQERFEYAGASGGFIDGLGYPFCRGRILSTTEKDVGQYDDARRVFWATGACMAIKSRIFKELGGFDADFFAHMEEIDLCWRAQLRGFTIGVVPQSVVNHLGGGTLKSGSPRKTHLNYRNNLMMLYKNLSARSLVPVLFMRMVLDGGAAIVYLITLRVKYFGAIWNAHMHFYNKLGVLRKKRKKIQAERVGKPYIYRGSILVRYLLGLRRFGNLM